LQKRHKKLLEHNQEMRGQIGKLEHKIEELASTQFDFMEEMRKIMIDVKIPRDINSFAGG